MSRNTLIEGRGLAMAAVLAVVALPAVAQEPKAGDVVVEPGTKPSPDLSRRGVRWQVHTPDTTRQAILFPKKGQPMSSSRTLRFALRFPLYAVPRADSSSGG